MINSQLSRAEFLNLATAVKHAMVEIEGLGTVRVVEMSGTQRDAFESSLVDAKGKPDTRNIRAKLAVATVCGDDSTPMFSKDDIDAVGKLPSRILDVIVKEAQDLNGMGTDVQNEIKKN